jgi:hypothetical protein
MLARISLMLALATATACHNSNNAPQDAPVDTGGPDASCFTNPTTHNEIINACTGAQKIYKNSHPPLLNADGSLPQLPM